jgi:3-isopropylmalate/(R)-2-methylmalate dehydratase small subunit
LKFFDIDTLYQINIMNKSIFGGRVLLLDRDDVNTDEIIPAKYLTEITKAALAPHLLEDLLIDGQALENRNQLLAETQVIVARKNFGCGSSREHAVWAFEVNGISLIIAESFARIFRQNMFNCGILAIELHGQDIEKIFRLSGRLLARVDLENENLLISSEDSAEEVACSFALNSFDKQLILAGGWLAYADQRYKED